MTAAKHTPGPCPHGKKRAAICHQCVTAANEARERLIAAAPGGHALLVEVAEVISAGRDFQLGPKGKHHDLKARLAAYFAKVAKGGANG
jgi:hypothetical protein